MTKEAPDSAWDALLQLAQNTRRRAHAPYSGFAVGAALETDTGALFGGCNVENRSFGLTICAERVALVQAVSQGAGKVVRVLVLADADQPPRPCGMCLDSLTEFAAEGALVRLVNLAGETEDFALRELLPHPFAHDGLIRRDPGSRDD